MDSHKDKKQSSVESIWFYVYKFTEEHIGILVAYVICICLVGLQGIFIPHYYGILVAGLSQIKENIFMETLPSILFLIALWSGFQMLEIAISFMDSEIVPEIQHFSRTELVTQTVNSHSNSYQEVEVGSIISKLVKFPEFISDCFYKLKSFVFVYGISILFTLGYFFYCHWFIGLLFLVETLFLVLTAYSFHENCEYKSFMREKGFDSMQEHIQDFFYNLITVFSNSQEVREDQMLRKESEKAKDLQHSSLLCGVPFRFLISIFFILIFASLNLSAFYMYSEKQLELSTLISIFVVSFTVLKMSSGFFRDCANAIHIIGHFHSIYDYFNQIPTPCSGNFETLSPEKEREMRQVLFNKRRGKTVPLVEFKNIKILSNSGTEIIPHLSLKIQEFEVLGIKGHIGCGKSTLVKTLLRLQCYHSGEIFVKGIPISSIPTSMLREFTSYVPQHPRLFNRPLIENISMGKKEVTEEPILKVLVNAGLERIAGIFKERMHKPVGKYGSHLSGGQCQIACLLRAVFRGSPLLILDEPTSSLDSKSKQDVMKLIKFMSKEKTVILITHDDSLFSLVSRIIHMKEGEIV
jgi:ABC-type multidrug transport system fused ATPase/permease subunit